MELNNGMYRGEILGERFEFPNSRSNKYCLIHFLRGFKKPSGKQGVFSQEQIAQALPDFDGDTRQSVDDHERRFRESGYDLHGYLTRRQKVDESVVEAVRQEMLGCPLRQTTDLVTSVNQRLNRQDLSAANITAALESISVAEVRPVLRRQLENGTVQYKESSLLKTMMEKLDPEAGELAGLSAPESAGTKVSELGGVKALLTPDVPLGDVSLSLFWIACMMRLFWLGAPLTVLGQWCHVHPTTVLRWILGLALALWPQVNRWLTTRVKCKKAYVDEKWIKIHNQWYYWCVALDSDSGLPIYQDLLATRSAASVEWIVTELRRLKQLPSVFITDGLAAYKSVFASLKGVTHVLCRFHHQQGVTRWLKKNFPAGTDVAERKAAMKKIVQTTDKRTVKRRFARLQERADEWGIATWVELTENLLPNVLPSIGSRRVPSTSNEVERFFGCFTRFAKVRRGFFSVLSTKRQLIVFLVVYVFSTQTNGKAPIESILPEASQMPLYRMFNDPFAGLLELSGGKAENLKNVKEIRGMAEFLTTEEAAA
ncbi:MAG: DDE-type integrase/transposase/recombinase [bacterium]|nr:DDE-type integrase/transposase/recombinase [bacterium]